MFFGIGGFPACERRLFQHAQFMAQGGPVRVLDCFLQVPAKRGSGFRV